MRKVIICILASALVLAKAHAEQVQALLVDGCTTPSVYNSTCSINISWPAAFLTTNYLTVCTASSVTPGSNASSVGGATYDIEVSFQGNTTTNATATVRTLNPNTPVTVNQMQCIGVLP